MEPVSAVSHLSLSPSTTPSVGKPQGIRQATALHVPQIWFVHMLIPHLGKHIPHIKSWEMSTF